MKFDIPHSSNSNSQAALHVMAQLEGKGFPSRLAGGCVRDFCMGRPPKDYDIATVAKPDEVAHVFASLHNVQVIPTGIDHGTITVLWHHCPIEVTTLRVDQKTDGRWAQVSHDNISFMEDARRRDFTINGMFGNAQGEVFDYVGGIEDLHRRRLRFIGDPEERIREDFLRILRFFRFWSRLGFTPDARSLETCCRLAPHLAQISSERVVQELKGILSGDHALIALETLLPHHILDFFWGRYLKEHLYKNLPQQIFSHSPLEASLRWPMGLAWLLQEVKERSLLEKWGLHVRFSKEEISRVADLVTGFQDLSTLGPSRGASLLFIERLGSNFDLFFSPILAQMAEVSGIKGRLQLLYRHRAEWQTLGQTSMPINGEDLMAHLGCPPGPHVGRILSHLKEAYYEGRWCGREAGLKFSQKIAQEIHDSKR